MTSWLPERLHDGIYRMNAQQEDKEKVLELRSLLNYKLGE